jgi:CheY-like chemotaxis protein
VEDNPADARLWQTVPVNPLTYMQVVADRLEAMAFPLQQGTCAEARRADLTLLDLHRSKMDGREVLAHINQDS